MLGKLIPTAHSDCVIRLLIRGKEKTHLNKSPSQINHRIPNVTLLNSHLTKYLYSKSTSLSPDQNTQKHVLSAKTPQ